MRIVAWDLETTNLGANFGRILCCSFKPITEKQNAKPYTFRGDDPEYANPDDIIDDGDLALAIRDELESYDIIVGHNSKLFDSKFLNARLLKAGHAPRQPRFHVDTMWIVRTHFRMSSKLDNVQKMLGLPEEKTPISWDDWARAQTYNKKAMDEVVKHCEQDVKVLEEAYWKLVPSIRTMQRG